MILIFHQLSTDVVSCWQLMKTVMKKRNLHFHLNCKGDLCAKFQLSRLIFIFIRCQQLLLADNSCWKKNKISIHSLKVKSAVDSWWKLLWKKINQIFIQIVKVMCVPSFGSLCWFSFLSTVNSCYQLLTADNNFYKNKLKFLSIPLRWYVCQFFSFVGWFSFSSAVNRWYQLLTADDSCYKQKITGIFN